MNIVEKKLTEIKPYEKNPRRNDGAVDAVANSIREFGFKVPVVIDNDGVIVCGHTRYKAAKKLKLKTVPCVIADDLTEEQIKAYRLADNKVGELAEWDDELLNFELGDIVDIDMTEFGFDLDGMGEDEPEEIVEDDVPEIDETAEPVAKLGDIWQLGRHRLMCGDSTNADMVSQLMDGAKADMVFTDPPYGMKYTIHRPKDEIRFDMIENDDKILDFFPCVKSYSDGFVFVCTTWKVLDVWMELFKKYFDLSNMIIWDKGGGGIGDLKTTFAVDYELILCSSRKHQLKGKRIGSVWSIKRDNANGYVHPTQKPVSLSSLAIKSTTNKNQNVMDLFGGSGSTLMACEQLERNCYMMEYDPKYVDVIIKRWEDFTGEKAVLLNGKEIQF